MYESVSLYDFKEAFRRHDRGNSFSYNGFEALFNWLEEYEDATDVQIELDVVAIDCEYTEYEDLAEIQSNYDSIETLEDLQDHTLVIEFDGGIIIQNF